MKAVVVTVSMLVALSVAVPTCWGQTQNKPRLPFFRGGQQDQPPSQATPAATAAPTRTPRPTPAASTDEERSESRATKPAKQRATKDKEKDKGEERRKGEEKSARERDTERPQADDSARKPAEDKQSTEVLQATRDKKELEAVRMVVEEFLKAAQAGIYSKAETYLSSQAQKYFAGELSVPSGGLKGVLDEITHNGAIKLVTSQAWIRGEGARVEAEIEYDDGSKQVRVFDLLKLKGDWKILLAPSAGQGEEIAPSEQSEEQPTSAAPAATPSAAATPASASTPAAKATPAASDTTRKNTGSTTSSALSDAPWRPNR